jgi:hypothetical protein
LQIAELARDSLQRAALKLLSRVHPGALVRGLEAQRVGAIEERVSRFAAVAEAVGEKEVESLVAPAEASTTVGMLRSVVLRS